MDSSSRIARLVLCVIGALIQASTTAACAIDKPSEPSAPVADQVGLNKATKLTFGQYKTNPAIELDVFESRTINFDDEIVRTSSVDPPIAGFHVENKNQLILQADRPGATEISVWNEANDCIKIHLKVKPRDYAKLRAALREIDSGITVEISSNAGTDRISLLGTVDRMETITKAFAAALVFMDDRGINMELEDGTLINGRIGDKGGKPDPRSKAAWDSLGRSTRLVSDGRFVTASIKLHSQTLPPEEHGN